MFLDSNQSLLSRQLNALERECGARLFNRTGRGVELSDVGQRIFPQVKALVWFQMNKETDWRIDSSAAAESAFVKMANDAYFNP